MTIASQITPDASASANAFSPKRQLGYDTAVAIISAGLALTFLLARSETFWAALGFSLADQGPLQAVAGSPFPLTFAFLVMLNGLAVRFVKVPCLDYLNAGDTTSRAVPSTLTLAVLLLALAGISYAFARSPFFSAAFGTWHLPAAALLAGWLLAVPGALLCMRLLRKA